MTHITVPTKAAITDAIQAALTAAGFTDVKRVDATANLVFGTIPAGWTGKAIMQFSIDASLNISLQDADSATEAGVLTGARPIWNGQFSGKTKASNNVPTGTEISIYGEPDQLVIFGTSGYGWIVYTGTGYDGVKRTIVGCCEGSSNTLNDLITPVIWQYLAPGTIYNAGSPKGIDFTANDGLNRCSAYYLDSMPIPNLLYYSGTAYGQKFSIGAGTYIAIRATNSANSLLNANAVVLIK